MLCYVVGASSSSALFLVFFEVCEVPLLPPAFADELFVFFTVASPGEGEDEDDMGVVAAVVVAELSFFIELIFMRPAESFVDAVETITVAPPTPPDVGVGVELSAPAFDADVAILL